jgi:hypothetical protein
MTQHRKIPIAVEQAESELIGEIVLFRFKPDTLTIFTFRPQNKYISDKSHSLILKVYSVAPYIADTEEGLLIKAVYVAGEVYTGKKSRRSMMSPDIYIFTGLKGKKYGY